MRLGVASWSFILCALFVFLVVQDSGARKIAKTSGRDAQLKQVLNGLKQLATDGHLLSHIMQAEGFDLELGNSHVKGDDHEHKKKKRKHDKIHDDDDEEEKDERDQHKKIKGKHIHVHRSHHMDHHHMDPELNVFFIPSDLKVGKSMPIYFAKKNLSTSPKFLTREEADQIPFSVKQLPSLLKFFSFTKHSPQAKAVKYTLKQCEFEPLDGETKFCATSLESLLDFARYLFGSNAKFKVSATTHLSNSTVLLQNYTILQVKEISVPKVIGCHPLPYPYAVFYCHSQLSDTSLFEVLLQGQNGGRVQAPAICHMDTSKWDPGHVSFGVLKVKPGTSPVCHFFPSDNLVLVPLQATL
ncbi:hypothetical protein L6164_035579 [Bauhinia variegata]|uniref:Uncharacterized protein n=1 Tax=Bauhinia variegata TaxID=167791 RepID=A0ACB9KEE5_BAUVA|nr:hypothetical protein L6164_035579 [Bauhinia variegata]